MARLTVLLRALLRRMLTPALLGLSLLGYPAFAATEPFGRLFFSPDERAVLEKMRQKNGGSTATLTVGSTTPITLDGIVRRSSGKSTTWINGSPQNENETPQGVAVQEQAAKPSAILLLPSGKQVRLKPGQTFDSSKGSVREGYEDAAVRSPAEASQ